MRVFNYHHGFVPTLRFSLSSDVSGIVPLTLYLDPLSSPFSLAHSFGRRSNASTSLTYCVSDILVSDSHNSPSFWGGIFIFFFFFIYIIFYFLESEIYITIQTFPPSFGLNAALPCFDLYQHHTRSFTVSKHDPKLTGMAKISGYLDRLMWWRKNKGYSVFWLQTGLWSTHTRVGNITGLFSSSNTHNLKSLPLVHLLKIKDNMWNLLWWMFYNAQFLTYRDQI